ncbi:hypothetical protein FRC12_007164 [Ceratobasidium sp. 428]|nr:hypothetical protein FRC12_007164 [Ceratobasidium sp. 428]
MSSPKFDSIAPTARLRREPGWTGHGTAAPSAPRVSTHCAQAITRDRAPGQTLDTCDLTRTFSSIASSAMAPFVGGEGLMASSASSSARSRSTRLSRLESWPSHTRHPNAIPTVLRYTWLRTRPGHLGLAPRRTSPTRQSPSARYAPGLAWSSHGWDYACTLTLEREYLHRRAR